MIGYRYQIIRFDYGGRKQVVAVKNDIRDLREYGESLDSERTQWGVFDKLKQKSISRDECFVIWAKA